MTFRGRFPLFFAAGCLVLLGAAPHATGPSFRWAITKNCLLRVDGATNVNKFSCQVARYAGADTLSAVAVADGGFKLRGQVSLSIADFDCHNAIMTADLRKTLKAKEFPVLLISFKTLSGIPASGQSQVSGMVDISLAGVCKRFEVDYVVVRTADGGMTVTGTRKVNFSDFNLVPPRKLGGMIRTENELAIQFSLRMTPVDETFL